MSGPPPVPWYSHPRQFIKQQLQGHHHHHGGHQGGEHAGPHRTYLNGAYYPNWRVYKQQPPSSLPLGIISHVFYSFAWVKPDGTVHMSDEWADTQIEVDGTKGCLRAFQQLKQQHPHLKVLLSVGGGGKGSDNFAAVSAEGHLRERFAHTARELVAEYGLDGIDIDWEHPSDRQQGQHYVQLLEAIRRHLPAPQYLLTTALPAGEWALQHIPLGAAARHLDYLNMMTYDFSGPWVNASGHHAQLYTPQRPHNDAARISCDSAVQYVRRQGVDPSKIVLGIPAYGRSFLACNNIDQLYEGTGGEEGTFEYKDLPRPGSEEFVDETVGAAWCTGHDGGFITYDNPKTATMKANYAKQNGLAGVFYWTGTADKKGPESLIDATYRTLHA